MDSAVVESSSQSATTSAKPTMETATTETTNVTTEPPVSSGITTVTGSIPTEETPEEEVELYATTAAVATTDASPSTSAIVVEKEKDRWPTNFARKVITFSILTFGRSKNSSCLGGSTSASKEKGDKDKPKELRGKIVGGGSVGNCEDNNAHCEMWQKVYLIPIYILVFLEFFSKFEVLLIKIIWFKRILSSVFNVSDLPYLNGME